MSDRYEWEVGQVYDVRRFYGRGEPIYQARVVRLTETLVVTLHVDETDKARSRRWHRSTALGFGQGVYNERQLVPAEVQP